MQLAGLNILALDAKGRLAIPARYRELIDQRSQGKMVLTMQHHGQSLMLYPEVDFNLVAEKVSQFSDFDPIGLNMKYLVIGHASYLEIDSSGRILIPQLLRDLVGIDKRVALIGQSNKFELWNEEAWLAKQKTLYTTNYAPGTTEGLKGFSF